MNYNNHIFGKSENEDVSIFKNLYESHYRMIYSYAAHFVKDHSIRMDIVQDVFSYVWENRNALQINKSIKSYLLTACHNTCINYINKQKVRQRHASSLLEHSLNYVDGYDAIFEQELRSKIDVILEGLPEQCRQIFVLSRIKGLKHKEIAELLNISPKTVETQIYRALKVFKAQFKKLDLVIFYFFFNFL